jgi:hypothetical protein
MITPHDLKLAEATAAQMTEAREFGERIQTPPCQTCRHFKASSVRPDYDVCTHPNAVLMGCEITAFQRLLTDEIYCTKAGQWWEGKV